MKKTVLTDIEGTTSSISFVKEALFPYARAALPEFVRRYGEEPEVRYWLDKAATDIEGPNDDISLVETLQDWIDQDRKHPALKALQGMIWAAGYRDREYSAHIYPDAVTALRAWHADGHPLVVYSSGSTAAQELLFEHTTAGDLRPLFSGYFDTAVGSKRESASYRTIVDTLGVPASEVVFLSDVVEELDAAREAGLGTVLLDRPEDYAVPRLGEAAHGHRRAVSFADIRP